jgi:hypothetical protein
MPRFLFLYWTPGACGDLIHSMLLLGRKVESFYGFKEVDVHARTRLTRANDIAFTYNSVYTDEDIEAYEKIHSKKIFLIPTHRIENLCKIKLKFGKTVETVCVKFSEDDFDFIQQSIVNKVYLMDKEILEECKKIIPEKYIDRMIEDNLYKNYLLKQLKKSNWPATELKILENNNFDYHITIQDIFNCDVKIKDYFNEDSFILLKQWIEKNKIYRYTN